MLRKKENFTTITAIPSYIPRQLAIDILHSHEEVININPLVIGHKPIKAPQNASTDEYYATWYEIEERLKLVPGIGRFGTAKINFNACFHDMPWGLQTHVYAPGGVDMRNNWRICGNQPGEPVEQRELGVGAPAEGLYLREDIEIRCNVTMVSFVKAEMKKASKVMVERMVKKAEMLDAGQLQGMFESGRLTTFNPNDRTQPSALLEANQQVNRLSTLGPKSPVGSVNYGRPVSASYPSYQQPPQFAQQQQLAPPQQFAMELPGDMYHGSNGSPGGSPGQAPATPYSPGGIGRYPSVASSSSHAPLASPNPSQTNRWSTHSADPNQQFGYGSPQPQQQQQQQQTSFAAELPAAMPGTGQHAPGVITGPTAAQERAAALKRMEASGGVLPPSVADHPAMRPSSGEYAAGGEGGKPRMVLP